MKVAIEIPAVSECTVVECAYNQARRCHARAITVGDLDQPECDTYFQSHNEVRDPNITAGVGACKAIQCRFNRELECTAPQIQVAYNEGHASCMTFETRP